MRTSEKRSPKIFKEIFKKMRNVFGKKKFHLKKFHLLSPIVHTFMPKNYLCCLQDSYEENIRIIIIESIIHVNVLIYVLVPYIHHNQICEAIGGCVYMSKAVKKSDSTTYIVIILIFVLWNIFCVLQLNETGKYSNSCILIIYYEKLIISLFETQLCMFLHYVKNVMNNVNNEIHGEIERREVS